MLIIWTTAKIKDVKTAFGDVISQYDIPHAIHSDPTTVPDADKGDVVLACGTRVLEVLMGLGLVPKNRTITSMRETPLILEGVTIMVTFDPSIVNKDYTRMPDLIWDCQLCCRLIQTGTLSPVFGNYQYVESLHTIITRVEEKYLETGNPVNLACDLETVGLDEYDPSAWIVSISFTVDKGSSEVVYFEQGEVLVPPVPFLDYSEMDYWGALWSQVYWLLTSPKVSIRGANWKYDSRWLNKKWQINCINDKFDTLLVGSLLDENRSNSLKLHAKVYTPLGGYEDGMSGFDKGRMDLVPKDDLLVYAGGDTDATYQVADALKTELLRDRNLTNFYVKLLQPSSRIFQKMETNGVLVDVPYYHQLQTEVEAEVHRLQHEMVAILPKSLRDKHADEINQKLDEGKNPLGSKLLKEFLFGVEGLNLTPQLYTEKTKEPSTAVEHLLMFSDNQDAKQFVDIFKEYGSATKTLSTYIVGFLKHLCSDDRFHPSYMLFKGAFGDDDTDGGAGTGRTSARSPAVQTIPKRTKWTKKLRRAFIAPEGYTILQADYAQGELKIAACVANEPTMIKSYNNGIDLHSVTAAQMTGYELDEFMLLPADEMDLYRSQGKAGNFGLLYGMSAGGFKSYAASSYGVEMTDLEANAKRDAFFNLYPALVKWHEDSKVVARRDMQIVSPLGRIRHLPLINSSASDIRAYAERMAINSPIQATLSDLMQLAMVEIDKLYARSPIYMFLMTHDSLALYVPIGEEALWAKRVTDIMANLPITKLFGWKPQLQFTADAEVSVPDADGVRSLATLKKFKDY